jgi:hypothetical protein
MWEHIDSVTAGASDRTNSAPLHFIFHVGDLLSLDSIIRSRVVELLDSLLREDRNCRAWQGILDHIERLIRDHYRYVLGNDRLRRIMRHCGNVFVAGCGEAAMSAVSLLGMDLPDKDALDEIRSLAPGFEQGTRTFDTTGATHGNSAVIDTVSNDEQGDQDGGGASKILKQRGEDIEMETDYAPEDDRVPAIGGLVRRRRDDSLVCTYQRTVAQEELRKSLLGAVVRVIR